jgi:predicted anti-sigma-YlaC factor YlaD
MTCDEVRVNLSARLDGEATDLSANQLDTHLLSCAGCRSWLAQAEQVTRAVRVPPAEVPDLTVRILAGPVRVPPVPARRPVLRLAVAVAAAVQLVLALPVLLGGADHHSSRELASFDVALAVGFALAAYRPDRARAYVPIALVLAVCLALTSALDMASSSTAIVHEIGHLAAVVQAGLLWALSRIPGSPPRAAALTR